MTQCDLIPGFTEFFSDLDSKERQQNFGVSTESTEFIKIPKVLEKQFDLLIKRLSDRLLWRLHHETNLLNRNRMSNFPLEMEIRCNILQQFLSALPWNNNLHLSGVYFTSSIHSENDKSFFVEKMFDHVILKADQSVGIAPPDITGLDRVGFCHWSNTISCFYVAYGLLAKYHHFNRVAETISPDN